MSKGIRDQVAVVGVVTDRLHDGICVVGQPRRLVRGRELDCDGGVTSRLQFGDQPVPVPRLTAGAGHEHERRHAQGAQAGLRPVAATSLSSMLASSPTGTGLP